MNCSPWPAVNLCIPTFRRPDGLRKLLSHIAATDYQGHLHVIVVENDADGLAGKSVVDEVVTGFRFPLTCLVEPRRGQTYAYNAAFAAACRTEPADYVAVLDDDEYPSPAWLTELVKVAVNCDVDIVGGPVFPVFDCPEHWLARGQLYEPFRYQTGPVAMIYGAGNMLIKRTTLAQYLDEPFSHAFAFTGGSDLDFFRRCAHDGRRFAWADDSTVYEAVPASRMTVSWLLLRAFRIGTDNTRVDRAIADSRIDAAVRWIKGCGLVAKGLAVLPFAAFRGRPAMVAGLKVAARGAGRLAAEFNIRYEEYR